MCTSFYAWSTTTPTNITTATTTRCYCIDRHTRQASIIDQIDHTHTTMIKIGNVNEPTIIMNVNESDHRYDMEYE